MTLYKNPRMLHTLLLELYFDTPALSISNCIVSSYCDDRHLRYTRYDRAIRPWSIHLTYEVHASFLSTAQVTTRLIG